MKTKETALFVGWGATYPGREAPALETFREWIEILEEQKREGMVEDYLSVLLGPHGGELTGFTLVFGEPQALAALLEREEVRRLQLRATYEHPKLSVIPAVTGARVETTYTQVAEEILPALERAPIAV